MKAFAYAALALAAAGAPSLAFAQGPVTASVGYTHFDGDDASPGALTGRVGYRFMPYVGAEGEGSIGIVDDAVRVGGVNVDVGVETALAAFAVGYLPLNADFDLFARAGYGTATVEGSAGGISVADDVDGLAFGVGGQYFVSERIGVRADDTRLDSDDGDLDTFSAAVAFRF